MGIRSRLANKGVDGEKGLHIAAANNNVQGKLNLVRGLSDDLGRWTPPIKLLNDHGIVPLLWDGGDVYMYGNRMYSEGRTPKGRRYTITERAVHYHIARDLFVTARPWVFKSISATRLGSVQSSLRTKLRTYWDDGWFSDHAGPDFDDQCSVLVPPDLNPASDLLEGMVTASISYRPRPAIEDLKVIITPTQLETQG
jgi:phage tail sheath protein FI